MAYGHKTYKETYLQRGMYDWDEDEEGEEDDKWTEFTGKNVILFLVDGTEAMQVTDPEDGRTLYQKAVEAACATMKGKKSLFLLLSTCVLQFI